MRKKSRTLLYVLGAFGVGAIAVGISGALGGGASSTSTSSTTVTTVATPDTLPACTDLGDGEVWITFAQASRIAAEGYGAPVGCDPQPGQSLNVFDVPSEAACVALDGQWFGGGACVDIGYG